MNVKVGGNLKVKAEQNIDVQGVMGLNMGSQIGMVNVLGTTGVNVESKAITNVKGTAATNVDGGAVTNITAAIINIAGGVTNIQMGAAGAGPAMSPRDAAPAVPNGDRHDPGTSQGPSDDPANPSDTVPAAKVYTDKPPEL